MKQKIVLILVLGVIIGAIILLNNLKPEKLTEEDLENANINIESMEEKDAKYERAKEITKPGEYFNIDGDKITVQELIGKKVILFDFWTYSCINCQRTLPYLNAWYDKYKDQGLEILGIHTPEFEFEKDPKNVQEAIDKYEIEYPVIQDNDFATWRVYGNRYWPRKYLIDIDGYIVYDHIGEGGYEETEAVIQKLLQERKAKLAEEGSVSADITKPNAENPDFKAINSPETYFGAWRNNNFGNGTPGEEGLKTYEAPETIEPNQFYLEGDWGVMDQYITNKSKGAKIIFKYKAAGVYFVASAKGETEGKQVKVLVDGNEAGNRAGSSVDKKTGAITVKESDLYRAIQDPDGAGEHTLELIFSDPDTEIFTFTFG